MEMDEAGQVRSILLFIFYTHHIYLFLYIIISRLQQYLVHVCFSFTICHLHLSPYSSITLIGIQRQSKGFEKSLLVQEQIDDVRFDPYRNHVVDVGTMGMDL